MSSSETHRNLERVAVATPARDISHRQFAQDISAARHWLTQHIPTHTQRVVLAMGLHPYLAWVLRVALLAERKWQVQQADRTPTQDGAYWIASPANDLSRTGKSIELGDLTAFRDTSEPIPVWDLLDQLSSDKTPVVTIYTSGSTGLPKGVVLNGDIIISRMNAGANVYRFTALDYFQCRMGPDTVGGFYLPLEAWRAGASVMIDPSYSSMGVDGDPLRYRSTVIMSSTTGFDRTIAENELWPKKNTRRVYLAGSRVQRGLAKSILQLVADEAHVIYGSTECGVTSHMPVSQLGEDPANVGSLIPGIEVSIRGDDGQSVSANEQGKVAIRSPWAVASYENGEQGDAFADGWFFPGDLGVISPSGQLRITGRSVETLNYGGEKFIASELETRILGITGVLDAFVTVVTHKGRERLIIMVVSDQPPEMLRALTKAAFYKNFAFTLVPVEQIPRNHMGKLNRPALTETIAQNLRIRPSDGGE